MTAPLLPEKSPSQPRGPSSAVPPQVIYLQGLATPL